MSEQKTRTKRQQVEEARRAAMEGRWTEALELNEQIIERFPRDAEAHNRRGRALSELRRYGAAFEAHSEALRIDPANMISRRNLQRLELLRHHPEPDTANGDTVTTTVIPRTSVFIEEVGKTWVDELVNTVAMEELAEISSGEQLQLERQGKRLYVSRSDGARLGEVEAKTAERMIELMDGDNRYEVYALGLSTQSLRVILREVYRDPSQAGKVSFPRQIRATRALLRERDLLRQRDEADFLLIDEDDEDVDDDDETTAEAGEDVENGDQDSDSFIEETVAVEDEEQAI